MTHLSDVWRKYRYCYGFRYYCALCGGRSRVLLPLPTPPARPNVRCPYCDSLDRERMTYLYLRTETAIFRQPTRLLHIAPEKGLQKILRTQPAIEYLPVDLFSERALVALDITAMDVIRSQTFDVVLCSHVLEHVPDDRRAMSEVFRVLRPGGWAILDVPLDANRDTTYEDPQIVTPEEREKAFGQFDHVRLYGRDYVQRLEMCGFSVTTWSPVQHLGARAVRKNGLPDGGCLHVCVKPLVAKAP